MASWCKEGLRTYHGSQNITLLQEIVVSEVQKLLFFCMKSGNMAKNQPQHCQFGKIKIFN